MNEINSELYSQYLDERKYDLASLILVKELVREPRSVELYYEFCRIFWLQNKLEVALQALQMVEKLEPSYRDTEKAMSMLKKKIEEKPMNQHYG